MASTQKIIGETVATLAERYGFDAKEALEFVMNAKKAKSPAYARAKKAADATHAKITELEQKIADKKVKNAEKSAETLAGLYTKWEEQKARLATFEEVPAAPVQTEEKPKKKRAPKKKAEETVVETTETDDEKPKEDAAPVQTEETVVETTETDDEKPKDDAAPVQTEEKPKKKRVSKKKADETTTETETEAEEKPKKKRVTKKKGDTDDDAAPVKEKRIARMTPTLNKQLKATFDDTKIEFADEHKKAFSAYINNMEEDAFGVKSLPDHMRDFVATCAPAEEDGIPTEMPADKKQIVKVTYEDLLSTTLVDAYGPGVYWDVTNKRFVRGPAAVVDEDVTETIFEGITHVVGDVSKRIYLVGETDVFTGFVGVGKFKTMIV